MAKKTTTETPEATTAYMVHLPTALHAAAKIRAIEEGTTLGKLIIKAIEAHLKTKAGKP